MRATEFTAPDIDEAAMNPAAFAQAVEAGQARGVLVGFEFEVGIPAAAFAGHTDESGAKTAEQVQDTIQENDALGDITFNSLPVARWDQIFQFRNPPPTGFASMTEAFQAMIDAKLPQVQELYQAIPEKYRVQHRDQFIKDARDWARAARLDKNDPDTQKLIQLKFAQNMGFHVYMSNNGNKAEQAGRALRNAASLDWADLIKFVFNLDSYGPVQQKFNDYFAYDPEQAWSAMDLEDYDDDYYDEDDEYGDAAAFLRSRVADTMGANVEVFHRYHQRPKNLTDWYIEPDGSLEANDDGDATAEIVSPPLPAAQAVDALKRFYALAAQLKLYTNSSTGLHINVSIPDKLDVLKLAVFLGDEYVLQQFGRQDSDYAVSSQRDITRSARVDPNVINVKAAKNKKNVFGQPKTTSTIKMKALQKLAQDATGDHTASISNNGKYISFRHAGGNYLADYASIVNVVGRFIRAMIIAADPAAYAREYQTKLAKLALVSQPAAPNPAQEIRQLYNEIRSKGVTAITIDAAITNSRTSILNIARNAEPLYRFFINAKNITSQAGGEAARGRLIRGLRSQELKQKLQTLPVESFVTITVMPTDGKQFQQFQQAHVSSGVNWVVDEYSNRRLALVMLKTSQLPPSSPAVQTLLKSMVSQHLGKKT